MGGGTSRWRRAAKRIGFPCASFPGDAPSDETISCSTASKMDEIAEEKPEGLEQKGAPDNKRACAICLEHLSCDNGSADVAGNQRIFTAQCMHTFHFMCIASNVRHGSVTCPICRAHWSQLPHELTAPSINNTDPVLRILDDSITASSVNHRSFLHANCYNDDEPVELEEDTEPIHPRLHFAIIPASAPSAVSLQQDTSPNGQKRAYLSVNLSQRQAIDLVLVASPSGSYLRLLKQSMVLVALSLRAVDRLAIITYATKATRAFPLRRMSSQGKQAAVQAIDRIIYVGEAEPTEGLRKSLKILEDRVHRNPLACILHLSDSSTRSYVCRDLEFPIPVHRFHIGSGFGMSTGGILQEFEEFLARLLGGMIRETQLRIGGEGSWIVLGDLRGGEERRIPVDLIGNCGFLAVNYSYVEGGAEQRLSTGEVMVATLTNDDRWHTV
ncbi:unnamed protein product [Musa acuminata subsp. burmannicoides]